MAKPRQRGTLGKGAAVMPAVVDSGDKRLRLDTLTRLRWLAIGGQSAAILFVAFVLRFPTPLTETAAVILVATVFNVAFSLRYPGTHRFDSRTSALLLGFDVLQLSALLYLTGGLQNPFALLILAPVMISAATLDPRYTVALGLVAMLLASVLAIFHRPLPWAGGQDLQMPGAYVAGLWVAILLALAFLGTYAWRVADEARKLARALAATELVLEREQHLTALDGLAAAAAHELGTPLSTIAVVAKEMQRLVPERSPLREDVDLLRQESARCRDILGKLTSLGDDPNGPLGELDIGQLLEEVAAPHRNFGIVIDIRLNGPGPQPRLRRNAGVLYGIGNLVENAVDFARTRVTVTAVWTDSEVRVVIADDGAGFPPEILPKLGEPYQTTRGKEQAGHEAQRRHEGGGLGLGLFIANTLLERSGARVGWGNIAGHGGAEVRIVWKRSDFSRNSVKPEHFPT